VTLAELLPIKHVVVSRATSKAAAIAELARLAGRRLDRAPPAIAQALLAREALGSTGVGGGIALPHARMPDLAAPVAFLARLHDPMEWEAIDGKPVDVVFVLLSPQGADAVHLAALAAMARRLREPAVAAAIRASTDPAAIRRAVVAER
jgi:PTS system nitrogen regulatory IIA component